VDGIAVPIRGQAGQQYVAHVLPLTSGLRQRIGEAHAAVAAVFIRKANIGWASPVETIAKLYKLTPSEIRILLGVVEYDGIASVASTLGISQQTVRTHLKHIFEKTGKRRQAELVKLVAEFVSPTL
jgi:DNA-binding CsgD family transcriptional regulator